MPTLLEVWESRLGVTELPGNKKNPLISEWCADAGHPEMSDNDAWCSLSQCSAAKKAELPFPPININPMARSWLTWGVGVTPEEVQPNDVIVWPRGDPKGPSGHVNTVKEVKRKGDKVLVRCIGGNQGKFGSVSVTDWVYIKGALPNGVRRGVPATVKDLRNANSSTIRKNDAIEKTGIVAVFFGPLIKGIESIFNGAPGVSSTDGLNYWQIVGKMGNDSLAFVTAQPWWLAIPLVGAGLWGVSYMGKRSRVAEHAAGLPIAAEVSKLGG